MLRTAALILCITNAFSQNLPSYCGHPVASPSDIYTPGSKIVNGKVIKDGSWPWLTALVKFKPEQHQIYQFCGSALINDQWIITAGHCVDSDPEEEMKRHIHVIMGHRNLKSALVPTGRYLDVKNLHKISRVVLHHNYDKPKGSTSHDIALIKLAQRVKFDHTVQPICLPSQQINATKGHGVLINRANNRPVLFVAGWGHQRENQAHTANGPMIGAGSDDANQVDIEMYLRLECLNKLRGYYFDSDMNCGGFDQGGKDSCQGDSGGPLIQKNPEGRWELQGVVSWGAGCARAGMPGIYTNVKNMEPWILETIRNN